MCRLTTSWVSNVSHVLADSHLKSTSTPCGLSINCSEDLQFPTETSGTASETRSVERSFTFECCLVLLEPAQCTARHYSLALSQWGRKRLFCMFTSFGKCSDFQSLQSDPWATSTFQKLTVKDVLSGDLQNSYTRAAGLQNNLLTYQIFLQGWKEVR